jgi:hypothetical protein
MLIELIIIIVAISTSGGFYLYNKIKENDINEGLDKEIVEEMTDNIDKVGGITEDPQEPKKKRVWYNLV